MRGRGPTLVSVETETVDIGDTLASGSPTKEDPLATALTLIVFFVIALSAALVMSREVNPALTDATADWLAVSAAIDGLDPWQDLGELAVAYEVPFGRIGESELGSIDRVHPRTPGALLVLTPLYALESSQAYPVMVGAITLALIVSVTLVGPRLGWSSRSRSLIAGVVVAGSAAYLSGLEFGTHSTFLLCMVAITWALARREDSWVAGIPLGIAIVLRIFPGLVLIPLFMWGRKRLAVSSVALFAGLNALGLMVFQLEPLGAVEALSTAASEWMGFSGNGSLAMPLVRVGLDQAIAGPLVVVLGTGSALLVSLRGRGEAALAVVVVLALLSSPLAWEHYDLLGFLVAGFVVWRSYERPNQRKVWLLAGGFLALQILSIPVDAILGSPDFSLSGTVSLVGRLVLLASAGSVWLDDRVSRRAVS